MTKATEVPPYLRIVAGIRRRIAEGELGIGDPVPSTRRIAREWGVALATATKALTVLRLEGVVETRPRVGTVVAGGGRVEGRDAGASGAFAASSGPAPVSSSTPSSAPELSLERIVRAGIEIADAEGLAALSMRGVAARLGVGAMSTYRYVPSKDDLVQLMADAAFAEEGYPAPGEGPEGWRARVELGARTLWVLHRRHPWLAQLASLTRPLLVPGLMVHAEWVLGALDGHGLDPVTLFDIHVLVYSHVQGLAAHLEREAHAQGDTGQSDQEWMDQRASAVRALAESGRFPTFAGLVREFEALEGGYDLRLDALFESGLTALLDGLAPVVERRRKL
ncbi:TetR/AcrR family transcriptional regulator C-terminal domain-containing protein [Streptomyces roseirectus]|uniref:TetR/AcrR family transcriptional regulator C-terminal domain-containing protein n=1 Tax=Streptomyces roseirectus TaxID=2768066 RepID=A0A7H0IQH9_9ACTN|nr:TetR/AcrR family transcriptional regulator C-terminal domain-containing protein [Streptomyces roseirectus]QNP75045.1 TetR/AcrR family transcriptional regulator C-terminal domain-containing protein [Streptomyces roseirectus]